MVARISTVAFQGIDVLPITTEVHIANGLPAFTIVGLPDKAVGESRERVRSAIVQSEFTPPYGRTTVNLAPADLRKSGSAYDLPIALCELACINSIGIDSLGNKMVIGELALNGDVRPIQGAGNP